MIGKIATHEVRNIPRITPRPPSYFAPTVNQKISWGTLSKIGVPSGRKQRGDLQVVFDETDAKSGGAGLGLAIRFGLRGG